MPRVVGLPAKAVARHAACRSFPRLPSPDRSDGGWAPEQLTAAVKPYGITTVQVGRRTAGKVTNRRGLVRAHIETAIAERDNGRAA